jgi:FKBP-type peptidyl-prolyl cis-trans isomerase
MKRTIYLFAIIFLAALASCGRVDYKKTKSGLLYHIIPSGSKDSIAKNGNWLKIYFAQRINDDSVLGTNYGKMPLYQQVNEMSAGQYDPSELYALLKKGDSVHVVMMVDSLLKQNPEQPLPPYLKKGDRITISIRVLDVFRSDSLYQEDYQKEYATYLPMMQKEREEEMAKMKKDMLAQRLKEIEEVEKSGEAAKQRKEVEDYLTAKGLNAQMIGKGTYVIVKEPGTGTKAGPGKYVTIKYAGRTMATDSVFESNTYPGLLLGEGNVIEGWEEGLAMFNEGGKGTLFIPGYLAYGKNPGPGKRVNEALAFEIEVLKVGDKP